MNTAAQSLYLKKLKNQKRLVAFLRAAVFAGFLILWETAARLGWIDSFIFSSPSDILRTFCIMWRDQALLSHIGITVSETVISFLLVMIFSMLFAVLLWTFPKFASVTEPYLVVLNSLPKSALAPLLIVWLGANMKTIIIAGMSVAVFGSVISLNAGFHAVDPDMLKLIHTLGGNKRDCLTKVVLPSSVPYLLSSLKVNIGLCLVGVVIGEFIGARSGLGYLIIYGSQVFKLNMVIMSIVLLCILAMIMYSVIGFVEKMYQKRFH